MTSAGGADRPRVFQTMEAEAVISTLRQEREAAQPKKA